MRTRYLKHVVGLERGSKLKAVGGNNAVIVVCRRDEGGRILHALLDVAGFAQQLVTHADTENR